MKGQVASTTKDDGPWPLVLCHYKREHLGIQIYYYHRSLYETQRVDSSLEVETWMTCVGRYETKPPIYKKCREENEFIRTNNMRNIGLMCLYTKLFKFDVINASTANTNYASWIK